MSSASGASAFGLFLFSYVSAFFTSPTLSKGYPLAGIATSETDRMLIFLMSV